ncbi:MAG TPA: hypothetical protein VGB37_14320 [Candidatus Lokiarchaeia archaeon]
MDIKHLKEITELNPKTPREVELVKSYLQIKQNIAENWFFEIYNLNNLTVGDFLEIKFGFSASVVAIYNDSNNQVVFSWFGDKIDGVIYSKEDFPVNQIERSKIFIKAQGELRIWAY